MPELQPEEPPVLRCGGTHIRRGLSYVDFSHPQAKEALQYAGSWLKLNGEAIFNTHPLSGDGWKDGQNLRFTHSDSGETIYATALQWPGQELVLHHVKLPSTATVKLLGDTEPLPWHQTFVGETIISLPARLQSPTTRPCQLPCVFKLDYQ